VVEANALLKAIAELAGHVFGHVRQKLSTPTKSSRTAPCITAGASIAGGAGTLRDVEDTSHAQASKVCGGLLYSISCATEHEHGLVILHRGNLSFQNTQGRSVNLERQVCVFALFDKTKAEWEWSEKRRVPEPAARTFT
jgi:hypothetical protein